MKKIKRSVAGLMVIVFALSISMNSFAAQTYASGSFVRLEGISLVLNCYTSQSVVSGTLVSTWSETGNASQKWIRNMEVNGRYSLRSASNIAVAINANRSYEGVLVNVLTCTSNMLSDYTFIALPTAQYGLLEMIARGGHSKSVAIADHGNEAICTWLYSTSVWSRWYVGN